MAEKKKNLDSDKIETEREIRKIKDEFDKKRHKRKMEELQFIRDTEKLIHDQELEKIRIKSAEIRKSKQKN